MTESYVVAPSQDAAHIIDAILEGGPVDLPAELRAHRIGRTDRKIKIRHRGGYEHFERDADVAADGQPVVFLWTGRTRVAE